MDMKTVLLIDSHPLFRAFLKQKLSDDNIEVILAQENRNTYTKIVSIYPNLIILDMEDNNIGEMEFLEKKEQDTNAVDIPVVITGPEIDKTQIASLAKYGVIKYFTKPIQFDVFFEAIGSVLYNPISMDSTPSILDIHRNNNIIFIEIALGLNRDKIALLQYKLSEVIKKEQIENPKIIIMLTNLELTFVDGYNLEFLIDNVMACPRIKTKNIKLLSLSTFVKDFLDGHKDYDGIECATKLSRMLDSIVDTSLTSDVSDLITNRILSSNDDESSIKTRFYTDNTNNENKELKKDIGTVLNIAIIDSNIQISQLTKNSFVSIGAKCTMYSSGTKFLEEFTPDKFNLIILDVQLTDSSGFTILETLHRTPKAPPILIYSLNLQRDLIIKALSLGANSYLIKPQKSNILVKKSLALLRG